MTIAISLVVGDGVVLGTDSATSIVLPGERYHNIYGNAEKTINLVKGLPLGLMTFGLGSLGPLSVASVARILREDLSGLSTSPVVPSLDPSRYTVEEVAGRVKEFFYDEVYRSLYPSDLPADRPFEEEPDPHEPVPEYPALGFVIAGFSAGSYYPEVWTVLIGPDGQCTEPELRVPATTAGVIDFWGQPEALNRLVYGWSRETQDRLIEAGLAPEVANSILVSETKLAHPGMPIQDAIDLVSYLADVTAGYMRFRPGIPTVSAPIDIAVITRFQGFKWVRRKNYYPSHLNPAEAILRQ
ncbi:MAG TPA: hypothetical protein VF092_14085 [Longimicrobium sp.]